MTARCVEEAVDARVVDGHLPRRELGAQVFEPIVGVDPEAVPARVRQVERHREAVEGVALRAEQLLEDALLRAQERVAHTAVCLKASTHHVEDPRPETSGGLELVEHHDDALPRAFRETLREVQGALEETLRVRLASELERELDVLVFDLDRRLHPGRDRLRVLEAALDPRKVLEDGVREALAEPADVGRSQAVDVGRVCAVPPDPAHSLDDDRRLSDPSRPRDEDVLAILEPLDEPPEVRLAPDQVGCGHRPAHGEVGRGERSVS